MRERPIRDLCQFCGLPLLPHAGITTRVQAYMDAYWPSWAPPFGDLVGDAHLWCLQQAGLGPAWNACSARHSIEAAGARPIIELDDIFIGIRPYELDAHIHGVGFRISHSAVRDVAKTGIASSRTGSFAFDLFGLPKSVNHWLRDSFSGGSVDVHDVAVAVGLVDHPLPTPVTRAFLTSSDDTLRELENDELVGGGGYECQLPDVAIDALRRYVAEL